MAYGCTGTSTRLSPRPTAAQVEHDVCLLLAVRRCSELADEPRLTHADGERAASFSQRGWNPPLQDKIGGKVLLAFPSADKFAAIGSRGLETDSCENADYIGAGRAAQNAHGHEGAANTSG